MALTKEEINRKLLHVFSGCLIPIGILYIPQIPGASNLWPVLIIGFLLIMSIIIEYIRFRVPAIQEVFFSLVGSMLRKEEKKRITGSTYIFASAFLCTILFFGKPHISFISLNLFILGDAVAAIVGLSMGRIKIGKKSLEGSMACFILCFILLFFVFPHVPLLLEEWGGKVPLFIGFTIPLSVTFFELVPIRLSKRIVINDNLSVPLITGSIIAFIYPLI